MPLSAEQKSRIKKILARYEREARAIVRQHKRAVAHAVTALDQKKAEEIRRLIG